MTKSGKMSYILWSATLIVLSLSSITSNPLLFQQQQQVPLAGVTGYIQCDTESSCTDDQTCCLLSSGQWGCCPFPQAVCCSDGESCCPNGYTCDVAEGKCVHSSQVVVDMMPKQKAFNPYTSERLSVSAANVPCNDTVSCEDSQTCCKLISGDWGCCDHPQAVCCEHDMCCPHGFRCDVPHLSCHPLKGLMPVAEVGPSAGMQQEDQGQGQAQQLSVSVSYKLTVTVEESFVQCDQRWYCPDGQTCCKLSSEQWGCCPMLQAVCCPDKMSCCPNGFICVPGGKCAHTDSQLAANSWNVVPSMERTLALYRPITEDEEKENAEETEEVEVMETDAVAGEVICPDMNRCTANSSCCQLSTGQYACCPYLGGVCCSDNDHCCPAGTSCNSDNNGCVSYLPWATVAP